MQTKLEIQKRKEMPSDWRIGMIAEREEFFNVSHYANQPRIDDLKQRYFGTRAS